jgi:hypothetical protein
MASSSSSSSSNDIIFVSFRGQQGSSSSSSRWPPPERFEVKKLVDIPGGEEAYQRYSRDMENYTMRTLQWEAFDEKVQEYMANEEMFPISVVDVDDVPDIPKRREGMSQADFNKQMFDYHKQINAYRKRRDAHRRQMVEAVVVAQLDLYEIPEQPKDSDEPTLLCMTKLDFMIRNSKMSKVLSERYNEKNVPEYTSPTIDRSTTFFNSILQQQSKMMDFWLRHPTWVFFFVENTFNSENGNFYAYDPETIDKMAENPANWYTYCEVSDREQGMASVYNRMSSDTQWYFQITLGSHVYIPLQDLIQILDNRGLRPNFRLVQVQEMTGSLSVHSYATTLQTLLIKNHVSGWHCAEGQSFTVSRAYVSQLYDFLDLAQHNKPSKPIGYIEEEMSFHSGSRNSSRATSPTSSLQPYMPSSPGRPVSIVTMKTKKKVAIPVELTPEQQLELQLERQRQRQLDGEDDDDSVEYTFEEEEEEDVVFEDDDEEDEQEQRL